MAKFKPSPYRDEIIRRLKAGETKAELAKIFPKMTVYYLANLLDKDNAGIDEGDFYASEVYDEKGNIASPEDATRNITGAISKSTGAQVVEVLEKSGVGDTTPEVLKAVRGILGLITKPKVLTCPTPELLYPTMIISMEEWGWPPMRPDDFIDTVFSKYLEATGFLVPGYVKIQELKELQEAADFAKAHGFKFGGNGNGKKSSNNITATKTPVPTVGQVMQQIEELKHKMDDLPSNVTEVKPEPVVEMKNSPQQEIQVAKDEPAVVQQPVESTQSLPTDKEIENKPIIIESKKEPTIGELLAMEHAKDDKPPVTEVKNESPSKSTNLTVGDFLARLNINNLPKEEVKDDSTERTKPTGQ